MPRLVVLLAVWCLIGCAKEPPVVAKAATGSAGVWVALQDLLGEGIAMGPERLGTTLHDKAAVSRCSATRDRLRPEVEKLRAQASQLGAVSIDDLSACVDCGTDGDQACSRVSAALERGSRPE